MYFKKNNPISSPITHTKFNFDAAIYKTLVGPLVTSIFDWVFCCFKACRAFLLPLPNCRRLMKPCIWPYFFKNYCARFPSSGKRGKSRNVKLQVLTESMSSSFLAKALGYILPKNCKIAGPTDQRFNNWIITLDSAVFWFKNLDTKNVYVTRLFHLHR